MSGPVVGNYTPNRRKANAEGPKDGKGATNRAKGGGKGVTRIDGIGVKRGKK